MSYDVSHTFGTDIQVSATGDILLSTSTQKGQERVLRRVLTNPGAYIWELPYGGGLPQQIGRTTSARQIQAIVAAQMKLEAAVAKNPPPVVTVSGTNTGYVYVSITYTDATTGQQNIINVPVG